MRNKIQKKNRKKTRKKIKQCHDRSFEFFQKENDVIKKQLEKLFLKYDKNKKKIEMKNF